jgi:hypothetical protein
MNKKFFAGLRTGCVMWILLLVAVSCQTASKRGGVNISLKLPEAEIRLEILQYTPAGSTAEQVLKFVRARLRHLGPEPEGVSGRSIKGCLGEFGFPAPLAPKFLKALVMQPDEPDSQITSSRPRVYFLQSLERLRNPGGPVKTG